MSINTIKSDEQIQREYYQRSADDYDSMHLDDNEHKFALSILAGVVDFLEIKTILDVGSGTGRVIRYFHKIKPEVKIIGIEPVKELREIGYKNGLSKDQLIDGNALNLDFVDNEFDLVCEFGMLHHVAKPDTVISEMLRASKKAIYISDSNNFGHGSACTRKTKQLLNYLGMWGLVNYIKTKGKGYTITKGDGLAYSYSVFNNYEQIRKKCSSVHIMNTSPSDIDPYKSARHVCLLGVK